MASLSHLTPCKPTKSNLFISSYFPGCCCKWTCLIQAPNIPCFKSHVPLSSLRSYKSVDAGPRLIVWLIRNEVHFYSEELLAPHPTPRLEDHPLSAVCDCLFNIFAATLHIGGHSSIRNLRIWWWQGPTYHCTHVLMIASCVSSTTMTIYITEHVLLPETLENNI